MRVRAIATLAAMLFVATPALAQSQDDLRAEIESIKKQLSQMDELKTRLTDLEKKLDEQKAASSVSTGYLKTEYSFNDTSGGSPQPSLSQWAIGVATKF